MENNEMVIQSDIEYLLSLSEDDLLNEIGKRDFVMEENKEVTEIDFAKMDMNMVSISGYNIGELEARLGIKDVFINFAKRANKWLDPVMETLRLILCTDDKRYIKLRKLLDEIKEQAKDKAVLALIPVLTAIPFGIPEAIATAIAAFIILFILIAANDIICKNILKKK